jgi:hypothetical protein
MQLSLTCVHTRINLPGYSSVPAGSMQSNLFLIKLSLVPCGDYEMEDSNSQMGKFIHIFGNPKASFLTFSAIASQLLCQDVIEGLSYSFSLFGFDFSLQHSLCWEIQRICSSKGLWTQFEETGSGAASRLRLQLPELSIPQQGHRA